MVIGPMNTELIDLDPLEQDITLQPHTLCQFPDEDYQEKKEPGHVTINNDIVNAVCDFCFPNEIPVTHIPFDPKKGDLENQTTEVREAIENIIYKKVINLRENMFTFTIL